MNVMKRQRMSRKCNEYYTNGLKPQHIFKSADILVHHLAYTWHYWHIFGIYLKSQFVMSNVIFVIFGHYFGHSVHITDITLEVGGE